MSLIVAARFTTFPAAEEAAQKLFNAGFVVFFAAGAGFSTAGFAATLPLPGASACCGPACD